MAFNDSFDEPLAATSSYTYPPPSSEELYRYDTSTQYDRGLPGPHKGPLLPVHQTGPLPPPTYPSLSTTWIRIRSWLSEEYAELGDTLNWGCLPELLEQVEAEIGFSLPVSVRESFCNTDGQELESLTDCPDGLFFGLNYLTLEEAFEEWKFWRTVDLDPSTGANPSLQATMQSIPAGYIRCRYSDPGWFPLATDRAGNYLGVDMNPGDKGTSGQVIVFGRDFDVKIVLSQGDGDGAWARWLASFAEELETGETFEIGAGSADASEGSDDGIGYGSYFYDGSGSSKGEGGVPGGGPGLHLTGGYRGWPVLEAFADRAFHVWQHLGKITTPSTPVGSLMAHRALSYKHFRLPMAQNSFKHLRRRRWPLYRYLTITYLTKHPASS
jgi:cell wall assembly regulator SMI1